MDKDINMLDVLDELLPGFEQFLSDLTTCKLSSALEAQVDKYNQNIKDYCDTILKPAPEPPKALNGNLEDYLAEERERSRMSHNAPLAGNSYCNVVTDASNSSNVRGFRQRWSQSFRIERTSFQFDENYEEPNRSPTVPTTKRPPQRVIDDRPTYEDPPDIVKPAGKSATMPLSTRYTEPSTSGGTLMSFTSSSSSQQQDDEQTYEPVSDCDFSDDGDDGEFSSTDYEQYDDVEEEEMHISAGRYNKAKTKPDKVKLGQEDKLAHFRRQHEGDPKVDHLGLLFVPSKVLTISKKSFGQWTKRYCLARDSHLLCYKNHDTKRPSQDLVTFGYTVAFVGQEGKQQNVFSLSHPSRGLEQFSASSKEDADKWIEVLQGYATMGIELAPSTGYVEKEGQGVTSHTGDELTKKVLGFLRRNKKSKESSPQLNIDGKGVLSGCINIMGGSVGEAKWRKRYLMIKDGHLACWSEDVETLQFEFPLKGTGILPADPKVTKRKVAMKVTKDNETLMYLETLNHLDMGPLLKIFLKATGDPKKDPSSSSKTGMVSSLLQAFEKQNNEQGEQEVYDEIQEATCQPQAAEPGRRNSKVMQRETRRRSETLPAKVSKMPDESPADSGKKSKKEKKKEDKKKKDKKGKGKEGVVAEEAEVVVKEKEPPAGETPKKRMSVRAKTAFAASDKSHLLDVDQFEIERKEVGVRLQDVRRRKADLRNQKKETTDLKQKELLEAELAKAQQEWSECNNRLAVIDTEIERLNKGTDPLTLQEQKQDSASAELLGNGLATEKAKDAKGSTSPGMKVAQRGGNVKDKLQMFQQMGNK